MSRQHSTKPAPRDASGKRITPVVMNSDAMMPNALKYPNGHLCNLHPDNVDLMRQAAAELGMDIEIGAPRVPQGKRAGKVTGVYLKALADAPALMEKYHELVIRAYNARQEHSQ